ncbi:MAG TPA: hypothetical protein VFD06_04445 [Candidatus Polarisedimenticolia bacterium]|nr:hypothetical protein [Candidatus Polarisedimenticolia bacterium]
MITGCATSATDATRSRGAMAAAVAATLLLLATGRAGTSGAFAAEAPAAVDPDTPGDLRDRFEKIEKLLRKAVDALEDKDQARVSFLLQRADEQMARFEAGSNVARYLASLDAARQAADQGTLPAAETALRAARTALPPLGDYTVARSMEIAFRAALQGAADGSVEEFRKGLLEMDEATLAGPIAARCREVREAMGRTRKAMGRNDAVAGRKELDAAVAALARIDYGGLLSRARSGLQLASELLRGRATLAARDQTQRGLKELAEAIPIAPEADREPLTRAQEEARTVWRRLNRAEKDDPDRLAAASEQIETLRRAQRS